jgi:hypothetical protein
MYVASPSKPTENDMARLSAHVALLGGSDFRFGVGGPPLCSAFGQLFALRIASLGGLQRGFTLALRLCAYASSGVDRVVGGRQDDIQLFLGEHGHRIVHILSSSMRPN